MHQPFDIDLAPSGDLLDLRKTWLLGAVNPAFDRADIFLADPSGEMRGRDRIIRPEALARRAGGEIQGLADTGRDFFLPFR